MNNYKTPNELLYKLVKSILIGLAIPIACIWIWSGSSENTWNEYLLITQNKITTNGFIISAEEYDDIIESNNDRSVEHVFVYSFKYTFNLPDGRAIHSYGKDNDELPEYLTNLSNSPYPVKVEYLPGNPEISRVKGLSNNNTILEWFRRRMLIGIAAFIFCSYVGYIYIRSGIKDYSTTMAVYKKMEMSAKEEDKKKQMESQKEEFRRQKTIEIVEKLAELGYTKIEDMEIELLERNAESILPYLAGAYRKFKATVHETFEDVTTEDLSDEASINHIHKTYYKKMVEC